MINYFGDVHLKDVHTFNLKFGLDKIYNDKPGFCTPEIMEYRIKFMLEELTEFMNACGFIMTGNKLHYNPDAAKNLEHALDGLIDLEYVLKGTVLLMGMGSIYDEAWYRVQEANMNKVRAAKKEESKRGTVYDVVKPAGWKSPQFKDLVDKKEVSKGTYVGE